MLSQASGGKSAKWVCAWWTTTSWLLDHGLESCNLPLVEKPKAHSDVISSLSSSSIAIMPTSQNVKFGKSELGLSFVARYSKAFTVSRNIYRFKASLFCMLYFVVFVIPTYNSDFWSECTRHLRAVHATSRKKFFVYMFVWVSRTESPRKCFVCKGKLQAHRHRCLIQNWSDSFCTSRSNNAYW